MSGTVRRRRGNSRESADGHVLTAVDLVAGGDHQ